MQTSASTQPIKNSLSGSIRGVTDPNYVKNVKSNNLISDMLTPNGLETMINGLKDLMRGGHLKKGKDMTMITPNFKDTNSGPSSLQMNPFFAPSPKIPVNFMPAGAINEVSSDGWMINAPYGLPQTDLGLRKPVSSSFGDNTLENPAGIYQYC